MREICDIHCHILPGLDDGAETAEEALHTLWEASRQHISDIIVTPHYYPDRYTPTEKDIRNSLQYLQELCRSRQIPIRLYPGQECFYYSGLVKKLQAKEVLTLADSRYVLVEFEPECLYSYMTTGLRELQMKGYRPILAHFERYRCLRSQEHLMALRAQGVLLQMNFDMLLQKDTVFRKNPWRQMVKKVLVDYLASDCHGMRFRPLQIQEAVRWIHTQVNQEIRHRMFCENTERILRNK